MPAPFGLAANGQIAYWADGDILVADPDGTHAHAVISGPSATLPGGRRTGRAGATRAAVAGRRKGRGLRGPRHLRRASHGTTDPPMQVVPRVLRPKSARPSTQVKTRTDRSLPPGEKRTLSPRCQFVYDAEMARPSSVLTALGFTPAADRIYQQVRTHSGRDLALVAAAMVRTPTQLLEELDPLIRAGIVRLDGEDLVVEPPAEALRIMAAAQAVHAERALHRLEGLTHAVGLLAADALLAPTGQDGTMPVEGEVVTAADPSRIYAMVRDLIRYSRGDILWLRPDQWRIPREYAMLEVVGDVIASGRRSRAIYPVRALHEAPEVLRARADEGEEIRVLPRPADPAVRDRRDPRGAARAARLHRRAALLVRQPRHGGGADPAVRASTGTGRDRVPDLDRGRPARRPATVPAAPAGRRGQGRADRAHPRPQPADRTPPGRRPDRRARRRHPLPGRRRGGTPRLAGVSTLDRCRPDPGGGSTNEYAAGSTCQVRCRSGP